MQKNLHHLAIIMDGNRRWAHAHGFEVLKGHNQGADTLEAISRAAINQKIEWLTVFAFSSENWQRPATEVKGLMVLMKRFILTRSKELIDNNIRLRIIGRRDRFSDDLQDAIVDVEKSSAMNTGLNLTVALDYGGRQDLTAAAAQIAYEVESGLLKASQVNDDLLKSRLSTRVLPPVDLLIRTGGEQRISNFLLWDLSYAELHFSDQYWPEFTAQDLAVAVSDYTKRERRFGSNSGKIHQLHMVKSDLA
ncbi:polyprenyl diphosphate synthase [Candidatus Puniceispirillum sp.]|nr:polyprenyl diphosphate synthase [Candidatus Puniceispirillum sp.]